MKSIFSILLLFIAISISSAQIVSDQAADRLKQIDDVVHFTEEQKQEVLTVFTSYAETTSNLKQSNYTSKRDYRIAKKDLLHAAMLEVHEIFTPVQLQAYKDFKKARQDARKAEINALHN